MSMKDLSARSSFEDIEWSDRRTGIRLSPGAIQNWPSASDEKLIQNDRDARTAMTVSVNTNTLKFDSFSTGPPPLSPKPHTRSSFKQL